MKEHQNHTKLEKGTLLVSAPEMEGIYFRSVILLCEHSSAGSFGIIINKLLDVDLPEDIIDMKNLANPNVEIRSGGPIQPSQMMLLHSSHAHSEQTLQVCEGVYLGGDITFLQEAVTDSQGPSIRLCFGYTGWGAGQLERELLAGAWMLHPGSSRYIFDIPAEKIWQTILRDIGGKEAILSMIPEDLSLN